jgi:CxxC motif-containing protein (DUF1111 family)
VVRAVRIGAVLCVLSAPAFAGEAEVRRGKQLFDAPWHAPAGQDQIGPLLNARSCASCHPGGGAGDPGPPALVLRTGDDPVLGRQIQPVAVDGLIPEDAPKPAWSTVRVQGAALRMPTWAAGELRLAGRQAPSLRGVGLLALIEDGVLRRLADPWDADGDGVSGQPGAGRFGAKAEHATLSAVVEAALTLDMGLATVGHPLPAGDCTSAQVACLSAAGSGTPVPAATVARLVAFVAALRPRLADAAAASGDGARLFRETGCSACHAGPYVVPSDPGVTGQPSETIAPYSDLLLHDLGPGLADPLPSPEAAEWRTAPLWGLKQRKTYLHDGRALSLREAIAWHDGEAAASRLRFTDLSAAAQTALLGFLAAL